MLRAVTNALAELVAAEARGMDLVDADAVLAQRTRNLAIANAEAIVNLAAQVGAVLERVEEIAHAPAIESDVPSPPMPGCHARRLAGQGADAGTTEAVALEPLPVSITPPRAEVIPDILPDPAIAGDLPGAVVERTEG